MFGILAAMRHSWFVAILLVVVGLLVCGRTAEAQTATPSDRFSWDQPAPSLAVVNAYVVTVELDGAVLPATQAATCAGTASPFRCTTPIPAVAPGSHSARIRVSETVNGAVLSSAFSAPLAFTMRAVPATPANLTIVSN